jgi:beta-glucosidase
MPQLKSKKKTVARKTFLVPYKNPNLPAQKRVTDLLARMTLQEKAAQMMCVRQEKPGRLVDANGNFDFEEAKAAFKKCQGLGQVDRPSDAGGLGARRMATAFHQQSRRQSSGYT